MKPAGTLALTLIVSVMAAVGCASSKGVRTSCISDSNAVQNIADRLPGKWRGKVDDKDAVLIINTADFRLSGKITYDGIEEIVLIEAIDVDQITLKGVDYQILTGKPVRFALDTFYGTVAMYDNFIKGNYVDQAGNCGNWFVTKEDISLPQQSFERNVRPQPESAGKTVMISREEAVPYPVFAGRRSSYETTSRSLRNSYVKESWGKNWWSSLSFHYKSQYRKTNYVRTYTTHRHYHLGR